MRWSSGSGSIGRSRPAWYRPGSGVCRRTGVRTPGASPYPAAVRRTRPGPSPGASWSIHHRLRRKPFEKPCCPASARLNARPFRRRARPRASAHPRLTGTGSIRSPGRCPGRSDRACSIGRPRRAGQDPLPHGGRSPARSWLSSHPSGRGWRLPRRRRCSTFHTRSERDGLSRPGP